MKHLWLATIDNQHRYNAVLLAGASTAGLSPAERRAEMDRIRGEAAVYLAPRPGDVLVLTPIGALPFHLANLVHDEDPADPPGAGSKSGS